MTLTTHYNSNRSTVDDERLSILQGRFKRLDILTQKSVSMLDRFDERFAMLESSIMPIHQSTEEKSQLEEEQNQMAQTLKTAIEYMDIAAEEEAIILQGPNADNLDKYLLSISRAKKVCEVLSHSRLKCCERTLVQMKQAMKASLHHLKELFRKRLQACSNVSASAKGDYSVSASVLDRLAELGNYIEGAEKEVDYKTEYTKIYSEVRSVYLKKSFAMLAQSAGTGDKSGKEIYQKGSSPFIGFTEGLIRMLKAERKILARVILNGNLDAILDETISGVVDMYVATGDTMIRNAQRDIQHNFFMLFDIMDTLEASSAAFNKCLQGTSKGAKIAELQKTTRAGLITFFPEFLESVRNAGFKPMPLPEDGTIHDFTKETLNSIIMLLDFEERLEQLLTTLGVGNWNLQTKTRTMNSADVGIVGSYILDVIDTLVGTLEAVSRNYGKPTLAAIFLMNNYRYIATCTEKSFIKWVGEASVQKYQKLVRLQQDLYQDSWKPVVGILMDVTYIKGGEVKKSLSSSEKAQVKERFRSFNEAFDAIYRDQRGYSIPDSELRQEVIQQIGQVLIPMYSRFADKYRTADFTKNAAKYIKYTPENLQAMLKSFFENAA